MIDLKFRNINRLVQSFKAGENDPSGNSFDPTSRNQIYTNHQQTIL